MRKLILKLFKGIPVEEVDNLLNQEYKKHRIELDAQTSKTEIWKRHAMSYKNKLESIPAKLDEMKLCRNIKKAIINKLSKG